MNGIMEDRDTKAMSPVYDFTHPAVMAAGLPYDELCRGVYRARELRGARLKALTSRLTDPPGRIAGRTGAALARWIEGLHRGPFTSTV